MAVVIDDRHPVQLFDWTVKDFLAEWSSSLLISVQGEKQPFLHKKLPSSSSVGSASLHRVHLMSAVLLHTSAY